MATLGRGTVLSLLVLSLILGSLVGCSRNLSPAAAFTYSPGAPTTDDTVSFTDTSVDADGSIVSWAWDLGDGSSSDVQNPSHSFDHPGSFTVSLTVTDNGGASDTKTGTVTVSSPPPEIGMDEAIAILVGEIEEPASSNQRISAFMLSEPLRQGDVVSSESGGRYPIDGNTWFIFVDDAPEAFFAHATRYVFIDTRTASYEVVDETWPPRINNVSMWNAQNLNRGRLIELYSILASPVPISGATSEAPAGDYGDAPDGQDAYYGVQGRFPTLFNTTNGKFGRRGGHTLKTGEETLGLAVSAEVDANDPADPDGVPNLVDADSDERAFVIVDGRKAKLAFTVSVSRNAPDVLRYANALIDFDQSGDWSLGSSGDEWVVVNLKVDVNPGTSETVISSWFSWGNKSVLASPVWMRLSLTRQKVDESLFSGTGWDGSGQYEYGEFEDYFVFLMDKPPAPGLIRYWPPVPGNPPGGDGKPPPGGGGEPPGPAKGPCGYDIQYHVITISGGDSHKDLAKGTPIVQDSVDRMADVAADQGYQSHGNLGPGNNSLGDIGNAFAQLAGAVKCGDHVLIYICGHGYKNEDLPGGGIALKDSGGRTQEVLKPKDGDDKDNSLEDFLKKIPPCPDEDCETAGKCCHVSVVIESCFAGNFNVPGVTGEGRAVVGTSTDTESRATHPGGGVYTDGLDDDLRDPQADTSIPPDGVDPMEAHVSARQNVQDFNRKRGTAQKPWSDPKWCECKCPCKPGIDVDKWVWDERFEIWMDRTEVEVGDRVSFRLEIENDGECRDIVELDVIDFLPPCLDYDNDAVLYFNGVREGSRPPDHMNGGPMGLELGWDLEEIDALEPGDLIAIEYDAVAEIPGDNVNLLFASAHCAYDYSVTVSDQDTAVARVRPPELPAEEVLSCFLEVEAQSVEDQFGCTSTLWVFFAAEDLTGGDYPVANVVLMLNGAPEFNSGTMSTVYYEKSMEFPADCGEPFHVEVIATNENGQSVACARFIVTPIPED